MVSLMLLLPPDINLTGVMQPNLLRYIHMKVWHITLMHHIGWAEPVPWSLQPVEERDLIPVLQH